MTQTSLYIRPAGPSDAGPIADISRQTFYDSFAEQNSPENMALFMNGPFGREVLMSEIGEPSNFFFLACMDREVLGYVKMRLAPNPPALEGADAIEIARIYVIKESIGKGVGQALMQHCLDTARNMRKEIIWLGVWEHNLKAISFYRKWGFERFGEHIFVLGNDPQTDWLMWKKL